MVRFAAALAMLAVLVVASLAWAAEGPPKTKGGDRAAAKGSVTSLAIRDNTIRLRDFSGPVRRLVRQRGSTDEGDDDIGGDSGLDGLDGVDGQDGENGVAAYEVVTKETPSDGTSPKSLEVECPPGKVVTGGGAVPTPSTGAVITLSGPQDDSTGWRASATGTDPWTLKVQAICAAVDP